MEDTSRRELFRIIGSSLVLSAAGSGVLSPALAQHVHAEIAAVNEARKQGAGATTYRDGLSGNAAQGRYPKGEDRGAIFS